MDFDLLLKITTPILVVAVGFIFNRRLHEFKATTDSTKRYEEHIHKTQLEYLEKKLTAFLNPIINAIEFDNETWERISSLSDEDNVYPDNISEYMEKEYIMANHARAVELARENMHFLELDSELHKELIKYMRHVAAYQSIRHLKEPINPIDIDEPFPDQLESLIRDEYERTLNEYHSLIRNPNKALQRTSR